MKTLLSLFLCLALGACQYSSGSYIKRPVTDPNTGLPVKNQLGFTVYEKIRLSQHAAIAQSASEAFRGRQTVEIPCNNLDPAQIAALTASGQSKYFESVAECERSRGTAKLVAAALGRPSTASGEITDSYARIVASIEKGKSDRWNTGARAVSTLGLSVIAGSVLKSGFEAVRDVGIEAANNGNVDIGSITTNNNSTIGASSNDPIGGAGTELTPGGAATSTVTSTITNTPETTINIGRGNRSFVTNDASRLNVADRNVQAIEPSGNGGLNDDSNVDQQPIQDENTGSLSNDPNVGNGNGLF